MLRMDGEEPGGVVEGNTHARIAVTPRGARRQHALPWIQAY